MRALFLAVMLALAPARPQPATLGVQTQHGWREWWREDQAPARWSTSLPLVWNAVTWEDSAGGVALGSLRLSGDGVAWRIRAIVLIVDPGQIRFALAGFRTRRRAPFAWTIADAPDSALFALNAGQFNDNGAWGWLVNGGKELQPPGRGPLAPAIVVDTAGVVRLVPPDSIATVRGSGVAATAFQSYPTLLEGDGTVPTALQHDMPGLDRTHRDSRMAFGLLRDGRVVIVLTRFEGLGGMLENLPFGLTTPEMAALLGALGASRAVLLDGGVSSQLLVRLHGTERRWTGWRNVPMGIVAKAGRREGRDVTGRMGRMHPDPSRPW